MEDIWNKIGETPVWVFGAIGALAFGYRAMRKSTEPHNLSLANMCLESCIGYAACATIPVVTPVVAIGIAYEDYCRRVKKD
jgi:hypothetical protein